MNVDKYLSLEYKNRGRGGGYCDCWGLARMIYQDELGITLQNLDGYTDSEDRHQVDRTIAEESRRWMKVGKPELFDLVVFRFADKPNHIGIMLSDSLFIHALARRGITIERISNALYRNRVENYYRWIA